MKIIIFTITLFFCSIITYAQLPQITLVSPGNSVEIDSIPITFVWETYTIPSEYNIQVATDTVFTTIIANDTVSTGNYSTGDFFNMTTYYWRVRGMRGDTLSPWSDVRTFSVVFNVPFAPLLVTPLNNQVVDSQNVNFEWQEYEAQALYKIQVSTTSDFSNIIVNATDTSGTYTSDSLQNMANYYWRVRGIVNGAGSEWSESRSFVVITNGIFKGGSADGFDKGEAHRIIGQIPTISLLLPTNNQVINYLPVNFEWEPYPLPAMYYLQVSTTTDFSLLLINDTLTANSFTSSNFEDLTTYYWRVRGTLDSTNSNWSEIRSFSILFIPPDPPLLLSPVNNQVFETQSVTFTWQAYTMPGVYNLQISTLSDFSNLLTDTTGTVCNFTSGIFQNLTNYYWRVRGMQNGLYSDWSIARSFVVIIQAVFVGGSGDGFDKADSHQIIGQLPTISLLLPTNSQVINYLPVNFEWEPYLLPAMYYLQISTTTDFSVLLINDTLTTNSYTSSNFENLTTYYWRVRGTLDSTTSNWSEIHNFSTFFIAPDPPVLLSPVNNQVMETQSVTFTWGPYTMPGEYTLQISTLSDFSNLLVDVTDTVCSYSSDIFQNLTNYFWRVRGTQNGISSDWSIAHSFVVIMQAVFVGGSADGFGYNNSVTSNLLGDIPNTISGTLYYMNVSNTRMNNCTIYLKTQDGTVLAENVTDNEGNFVFYSFNGNYQLTAATTKPWGGLNIQDVVLTRQKIAFLTTFSPLQNKAADVNLSNFVNVQDVVIMRQKVAFLNPPNWLISNYVFENPQVVVNAADVIINFMGACAGDVNGSYVPPE